MQTLIKATNEAKSLARGECGLRKLQVRIKSSRSCCHATSRVQALLALCAHQRYKLMKQLQGNVPIVYEGRAMADSIPIIIAHP